MDKAGKKREIKSGMPQLDPAAFPLLHPRSTFGWRWFIKKGEPKQPLVKGTFIKIYLHIFGLLLSFTFNYLKIKIDPLGNCSR
jgi:hypothetical protein